MQFLISSPMSFGLSNQITPKTSDAFDEIDCEIVVRQSEQFFAWAKVLKMLALHLGHLLQEHLGCIR